MLNGPPVPNNQTCGMVKEESSLTKDFSPCSPVHPRQTSHQSRPGKNLKMFIVKKIIIIPKREATILFGWPTLSWGRVLSSNHVPEKLDKSMHHPHLPTPTHTAFPCVWIQNNAFISTNHVLIVEICFLRWEGATIHRRQTLYGIVDKTKTFQEEVNIF